MPTVRTFPIVAPYDFAETTRLLRTGNNDPTFRREEGGFWRAARFPGGTATVHVERTEDGVRATAWGEAADEALDRVPRLVGLHEAPWDLPDHPEVSRMLKAKPGVRLTDTGAVYEAVINITLQQLVTWAEAAACWRRLVEHLGEEAPGPAELRVMPAPRTLARTSPTALQDIGIGGQHARRVVEAARVARRLEEAATMSTDDAFKRLTAVRGLGPWTATSVLGMRLGRPQRFIEGDYHMPNTVCWALAGEPRGDDARARALLAPFTGQVFRVVRLMGAVGVKAPQRGPKRAAFRRRF